MVVTKYAGQNSFRLGAFTYPNAYSSAVSICASSSSSSNTGGPTPVRIKTPFPFKRKQFGVKQARPKPKKAETKPTSLPDSPLIKRIKRFSQER